MKFGEMVIITKSIVTGVAVCVLLVISQAVDTHIKLKKELEVLEVQKETSLVERDRYEKQIELINIMLENEKIKTDVYKKVK